MEKRKLERMNRRERTGVWSICAQLFIKAPKLLFYLFFLKTHFSTLLLEKCTSETRTRMPTPNLQLTLDVRKKKPGIFLLVSRQDL